MFPPQHTKYSKFRTSWINWFGPLVILLLAIIISGCKTWDLRGEGFADRDLSDTARQARSEKKENHTEYWSFSTKAQQIERDLLGQ